jgi:flagellar motor switch protein FliM
VDQESLSQNEIDRLFTEGGDPDAATATAPDESGIQPYDFRKPNLISKERLRALEVLYGGVCKSLENWLTQRVRGPIEVRLLGVGHYSFGEFTLSLPNPTSSYLFDTAPGGPQVVIDFGRDLAFFLVDRLLGGTTEVPLPDRALTVVERMIVRIAAEHVSGQLVEAWKDHVELGLKLSRFESVPEMLSSASRDDAMLVAHIETRATNLNGALLVCIPFAFVETFFTAPAQRRQQRPAARDALHEADRLAVESTLRATSVQVTVCSPEFQIPLELISSLQPGVTLMTGLPSEPSLPVWIEDQIRFIAQPGRSGRALAVRVTGVFDGGAGSRNEQLTRSSNMATVTGGDAGAGANLAELKGGAVAAGAGSLGSLFGLTLPVSIELGRARMSIQDVLELGRGSVIPLERLVGEPVDVIIGDRRFAEGEVVVIGEQFGVRITRIVPATAGAAEQP